MGSFPEKKAAMGSSPFSWKARGAITFKQCTTIEKDSSVVGSYFRYPRSYRAIILRSCFASSSPNFEIWLRQFLALFRCRCEVCKFSIAYLLGWLWKFCSFDSFGSRCAKGRSWFSRKSSNSLILPLLPLNLGSIEGRNRDVVAMQCIRCGNDVMALIMFISALAGHETESWKLVCVCYFCLVP